MKQILFKLLSIMMVFSCLVSCVDIDMPWPYGNNIVINGPTYITPGTMDSNGNFAITFQGYQQSRSAIAGNYTDVSGYDAFKLFAWKDNGAEIMNPYDVEKSANGWAYAGVGTQEVQYYDKSAGYYNFISVISDKTPTSTSANTVKVEGVESFLVEDGVSTDKELLHATAHVTAANYAKGMTLPFSHDNAVIRFQFYSDDAATKLINFRPAVSNSVTAFAIDTWTSDGSGIAPTGTYQTTSLKVDNTLTQTWVTEHATDVNSQFKFYDKDGKLFDPTKYSNGYRSLNLNVSVEPSTSFNVKYIDWTGVDIVAGLSAYTTLRNYDNKTLQYLVDGGYIIVAIQSDYIIFVKKSALTESGTLTKVPVGGTIEAIDGFVVLPAKAGTEGAKNATVTSVCKTADATITMDNVSFVQKSESKSLAFSLTPEGNVGSTKETAIKSPTNFYALPVGTADNGMTVKVSYNYKGNNIYDSRIFIPADKCQWEAGKFYTYTINIAGIGNGTSDPTKADPEDPKVDNTQLEVASGLNLINVTVSGYAEEDGGEYIF